MIAADTHHRSYAVLYLSNVTISEVTRDAVLTLARYRRLHHEGDPHLE
jgi:hypothetical protein